MLVRQGKTYKVFPSGLRRATALPHLQKFHDLDTLGLRTPDSSRVDLCFWRDMKMIEITGLWINESLAGEKYMVGYFGKSKVLIFKNKYKEQSDKQPDYRMFVASQDVTSVFSDEESTDVDI
jgi:hypothetical protein